MHILYRCIKPNYSNNETAHPREICKLCITLLTLIAHNATNQTNVNSEALSDKLKKGYISIKC